jgi:hypothetical protein
VPAWKNWRVFGAFASGFGECAERGDELGALLGGQADLPTAAFGRS